MLCYTFVILLNLLLFLYYLRAQLENLQTISKNKKSFREKCLNLTKVLFIRSSFRIVLPESVSPQRIAANLTQEEDILESLKFSRINLFMTCLMTFRSHKDNMDTLFE